MPPLNLLNPWRYWDQLSQLQPAPKAKPSSQLIAALQQAGQSLTLDIMAKTEEVGVGKPCPKCSPTLQALLAEGVLEKLFCSMHSAHAFPGRSAASQAGRHPGAA